MELNTSQLGAVIVAITHGMCLCPLFVFFEDLRAILEKN
jgi:ABC-type polysaccharide/polyol phosphate export permease